MITELLAVYTALKVEHDAWMRKKWSKTLATILRVRGNIATLLDADKRCRVAGHTDCKCLLPYLVTFWPTADDLAACFFHPDAAGLIRKADCMRHAKQAATVLASSLSTSSG